MIELDHGFYYGIGFFETLPIYQKPVFLQQHIHRINTSLEAFKLSKIVMENEVLSYIEANNLSNCVLKFAVSEKNLVFSTRPLMYTSLLRKEGVAISFSSIIKSSTSRFIRHKSLQYGENFLELQHVRKKGFFDALFINEKGNITETTICNIFLVKDGKIETPSITDGLLPGIMREYICTNYPVTEKNIQKDDIFLADEVFLTNSLAGILQVNKIDTFTFPNEPKITMELIKNYEALLSSYT